MPEAIAAPEPTIAVAAPTQPIGRYRLDIVAAPLPLNGFSSFKGERYAIVGDGAVAEAVVARFVAEGIDARLGWPAGGPSEGDALHGLVDLTLRLDGDPIALLGGAFERARAAALAGAKQILLVTGCGGDLLVARAG